MAKASTIRQPVLPGRFLFSWYWLGLVLFVLMVLTIFQDYLFSELQDTGFYLSESLLYNCIWWFFLPLLWLEARMIAVSSKRKGWLKVLVTILGSALCAVLHLLLFTLFFVGVSQLVYTPGHRFYGIFVTALSNQFYLVFGLYLIAPFVSARLSSFFARQQTDEPSFPAVIPIKSSGSIVQLAVHDIQLITTDKPYTLIHTEEDNYLDNRSLKALASLLDPQVYIRVHRSAIINRDAVQSLNSRQNGDYDALLGHGKSVRLSRHYRANWQQLLH